MRRRSPFRCLSRHQWLIYSRAFLIALAFATHTGRVEAQVPVEVGRALPKPILNQVAVWPAKLAGSPVAVRVVGNYAYVGVEFITSSRGLAILDVTHPGSPVVVSQSVPVSETLGLDVVGQYAYLACAQRASNLQIVDISDPRNPKRVGIYGSGGIGLAVRVAGRYAYLLSHEDFRVVDVSDPFKPALVGVAVVPTGSIAPRGKVNLHGNLAYLCKSGRLSIVDVTNPAKPVVLPPNQRLVGTTYDIEFNGDVGYLAGTPIGIWNFADPKNPTLVSTLNGEGASDLKRIDNLLFAKTINSLVTFDVAIPSQPRQLTSIIAPGDSWEMDTTGDVVWLAQNSAMQAIDLRGPMSPATPVRWLQCKDFRVANGVAYTALDPLIQDPAVGGLNLLDVADPVHPRRIGFYPTDRARAVRLESNVALLISDIAGIQFIDVSQPAKLVLRGSYPAPKGSDAQLLGGFAYVVNPTNGFEVVDLADAANPRQTGAYRRANLRQVQVAGSVAYVTSAEVALQTIDIGDPANPLPRGNVAAGGATTALQVAGATAFVAQGTNLLVIDVRDPWTPALLSTYSSTNHDGGISRIEVADGLVFLARGSGLEIVDATDRLNLVQVGGEKSAPYNSAQLAGGHLFLGSDAEGLRVFAYDKAPRFSLFSKSANGDTSLTVLNGTGRPFSLEGSINLKDWLVVTNVSSTEQTNLLIDPGARDAARRFYRVVTP